VVHQQRRQGAAQLHSDRKEESTDASFSEFTLNI